jgi:hypothetical protein
MDRERKEYSKTLNELICRISDKMKCTEVKTRVK